MTKPKIRFPEFKEDWKTCLVQDVLERVVNPVNVKPNVMYKQIGIRSHGKGIFYKEEVTGLELGNKRVFWIEPDCFVVNIVFAWERAIAKTTGNELGMIASHRFPMYKPIYNKANLDYLVEYFVSNYGHKILILASPGGAGRNKTLGQDEFLKSRLQLPAYAEQKKISTFFAIINNRVILQQKIIADLEEQKKGLMQKLFSQEVRFKDKNGIDYEAWRELHIGNILEIKHGKDYKEESCDKGLYPVLGTGGVITYIDTFICDWECVLIGRKGTIDKPRYMNSPFWSVDTLFYSRPFEGESPLFQYYLFQCINWKRYDESTGVPSLSASTIENIKVNVPFIEEQKKIADCLMTFDKKIEVEKAILEDWKQIKKGLLQQMFI